MSLLELESAIELDVEADREPIVEGLHRDMVHEDALASRDQHDALEHALVVGRDRTRRDREIGALQFRREGARERGLELAHPIERQAARHGHAHIPHEHAADETDPHAVDAEHARHAPGDLANALRHALGRRVEQHADHSLARASPPRMAMNTATTSVALASALA